MLYLPKNFLIDLKLFCATPSLGSDMLMAGDWLLSIIQVPSTVELTKRSKGCLFVGFSSVVQVY